VRTVRRADGLTAVGGVLAVAGVLLAVLATRVSTDLTRQRSSTCNGLLPMPASAYVLGWSAVAAGLVAVLLLVLRLRKSRGGWPTSVLVLAVLAVLFAGFVTYTVYGDAPVTHWLCSG
jgi:ABC-type xylose transport system permease subunit